MQNKKENLKVKVNQAVYFYNEIKDEWSRAIVTGEDRKGFWFMFDGHQEFYLKVFEIFQKKERGILSLRKIK